MRNQFLRVNSLYDQKRELFWSLIPSKLLIEDATVIWYSRKRRRRTDGDAIDIRYPTTILQAEALVGSTRYSRSWPCNRYSILNRRRRDWYSRNYRRRDWYPMLNNLTRGASGSADLIHLVLKESETRSIFDSQGNLVETRSINIRYSRGRQRVRDTIDTQRVGHAINIM